MTNAAAIAQALASNMAKAQDEPTPDVETVGDSRAEFVIDTPMGRFRVDVTEIE